MGLITLTNIEDGQDASANPLNERFGKIVDTINGNIDSENIKNGAITAPKLAAKSVTSDKLDVSKYVDDNGWTVYDMGTQKVYTRKWSITGGGGGVNKDPDGLVIGGSGARASLGSFKPPVGVNINNIAVVATWFGRYSGHLVVNGEIRNNQIQISGGNIWPGALAYKGDVHVQATELI